MGVRNMVTATSELKDDGDMYDVVGSECWKSYIGNCIDERSVCRHCRVLMLKICMISFTKIISTRWSTW